MLSCSVKPDFNECTYSPKSTSFKLWAPTADSVCVSIYADGAVQRGFGGLSTADGGSDVSSDAPLVTKLMKKSSGGYWKTSIDGDLMNRFYTFRIFQDGRWLAECPGINAHAVGLNGRRAAIIDMKATDPEGWDRDKAPELGGYDDIIIYETHHRDFSKSDDSGMQNKGLFLAWTEDTGDTGIDHLVDLGVTHMHILPSFDSDGDEIANPYNWGYDPLNYNVPEGRYSTDPTDPYARIREFKQMVQSMHRHGLRVVLDVVYNHTSTTGDSNFDLTAPGYFYRFNENGTYSNGSGCGNETASEKEMMRAYMIESVLYWMKEYHIDGFRFDLMGIHDIETMNAIRAAVDDVDPSVFIYGEGWSAGSCAIDGDRLAMKAVTYKMPRIAAFGDEMRDAVRGPFFDDNVGAFLCGIPGHEENIRFGILGATDSWAAEPTQMIAYVSCHDDMCLGDRVKNNLQGPESDRQRAVKLAETIVLTSQGVPFIYGGDEFLRTKKMVHNSFESPDSVNVIEWKLKDENRDVYEYVKGIVAMRKAHKAFHMGEREMVRNAIEFLPVEGDCLVAFRIDGSVCGDSWNDIYVAFNGSSEDRVLEVPCGDYLLTAYDGNICAADINVDGKITVPRLSALIMSK